LPEKLFNEDGAGNKNTLGALHKKELMGAHYEWCFYYCLDLGLPYFIDNKKYPIQGIKYSL